MGILRKRASAEPQPAPPGDPAHHAIEVAISYHARTKHHFHRYASALGFLDWDTQPDPFRRWNGAPLLALPRPTRDRTPPFASLWRAGAVPPSPLDAATLSELFYFGLAISAWKRYETAHWSLRVDPSSGNLHPTECYALLPPVAGLTGEPAVLHYAPREHGLEQRATLSPAAWSELARAFALPPGGFLLALTSIPWRESWKYGERAWRYCQHDAGHALAALRLSAALQGWTLTLLPDVEDALLAALVGLDRAQDLQAEEPEVPELLAVVRPASASSVGPMHAPDAAAAASLRTTWRDGVRWAGRANVLSSGHQEWPVIDVVDA